MVTIGGEEDILKAVGIRVKTCNANLTLTFYRRIRTRVDVDDRGLIVLWGDRDWKEEFDAMISIRHLEDDVVRIRVRPIVVIRHDS